MAGKLTKSTARALAVLADRAAAVRAEKLKRNDECEDILRAIIGKEDNFDRLRAVHGDARQLLFNQAQAACKELGWGAERLLSQSIKSTRKIVAELSLYPIASPAINACSHLIYEFTVGFMRKAAWSFRSHGSDGAVKTSWTTCA
ncbi:hypothetical protein F5B22DRAFT_641154 [Xylaria bambusicola]|uniref:uncharacterized protein n=1 Tax=Xylaria bambusicola TaxID=326684 RepID=UPI0020072744|nr:uncharacterized protein F5B22DRAFT_641154 [Xylaria bambusicola]KAI0528180.1 hypothetical protein F5B22DRAFT_641154 [Xylaria bambusicola]